MSDEQMELNIVRKVVWSYARSTGLDFDELCSEAYPLIGGCSVL